MLATYNDLVGRMASDGAKAWSHRTDLNDIAPVAVQLFEAQFSRMVRVRQMLARTPITVTQEYASLPSDFGGVITLSVNGQPLEFADPDTLGKLAYAYTTGGQPACAPQRYTILGSQVRLFPAPLGSLTGELAYWQRLPALATAGSNWLLSEAPDIYLFGSLAQLALYARDDARAQTWGGLAASFIGELKARSVADSLGGSFRLEPSTTVI